jgi:Amt family ammonium transporter
VVASAALAMVMTPGLGLFYGGLVGQKNALSTITYGFFILAMVSVQWVVWGYSLAFGPAGNAFIGGLDWVGLRGGGVSWQALPTGPREWPARARAPSPAS